MSVTVHVDTNPGEDGIASSLEKLGFNVTRARMDVGDVRLACDDHTILVERKTWDDLSASIRDGRWSEQKSRMNDPDITYIIMVEGEVRDWTGHTHGMRNSCVWAALVKTGIRDKFGVNHVMDTDCAAHFLSYLAEQLKAGTLMQRRGTAIPGITNRKRDNLSSPEQIFRAMLYVIPGMSGVRVDVLTAAYPTVQLLLKASTSDIANLLCNGRRLGDVLAGRIFSVFH